MILFSFRPYKYYEWHFAYAWWPVWAEVDVEDQTFYERRRELIWLQYYMRVRDSENSFWSRKVIRQEK